MTQTCCVYGIGLSVNVPLAGLRALPAATRVDVRVELGRLPPGLDRESCPPDPFYVTDETDEAGRPLAAVSRIAAGAYYRIDYSDATQVIVDAEGCRIWADGEGASAEETATYLLGPVLGFALRLRGVVCLHASAVEIDGRAVAFVGASGAGKSSIAAAFARQGRAVLCDDVMPVAESDGAFHAHPAYPRLRLWPDAVESLFGSADALPRIVQNWDKRFVDLAAEPFRFRASRLPLAAIYVLEPSDGSAHIATLSSREALLSLIAATYANGLVEGPLRAAEFGIVARLVDSVAVRRLRRGDDLRGAARICTIVEADLDGLARS